ncbi:MAG: class I SAM-dependent methyltransferase [bacterium]|nr:class I SAM-dependent methyltransferase [bacterium]
MEYNSKAYALLNRGYKRHFKEVVARLGPRREDRILEIGCARGVVVRAVQDIAPATYGVDVNPEAIKNGVTRNLSVMSGDQLSFENESFDKVYSFHTIEHILPLQNVFKEIARILKPGGKVLLVYPAEPVRGLFSIVASFVMFKHPFRARAIHVHKLTPKKIQELIFNTGLIHQESGFSFLKGPEFFTVLRKRI